MRTEIRIGEDATIEKGTRRRTKRGKVKNRLSKEKIKPKKTAYCGYQALWSTDH